MAKSNYLNDPHAIGGTTVRRFLYILLAFAWLFWERSQRLCLSWLAALALLAAAMHFEPLAPLRAMLSIGFAGLICAYVAAVASPFVWSRQNPIFVETTVPFGGITLPVTDSELLLAPFVLGFVGAFVGWSLFALTTLLPLGVQFDRTLGGSPIDPVFVPLALFTAYLSVCVHSIWNGLNQGSSPLPTMFMPAFAFITVIFGTSNSLIYLVSGFIILGCLLSGRVSVARTRHGRPAGTTLHEFLAALLQGNRKAPAAELSPYPSAWRAQLWYEQGIVRIGIWILPLALILLLALAVGVPMLDPIHDMGPRWWQPLGIWDIRTPDFGFLVSSLARYLPLLILGFSGFPITGMQSGNTAPFAKVGMDRLSAVLPLSTVRIVGAKLALAAETSLACLPVLGLWLLVFVTMRAREGDRYGTVTSLVAAHLGPRSALVFFLGILALPVMVWSALSGNPLRHYLKAGMMSLVFCAVMLGRVLVSMASLALGGVGHPTRTLDARVFPLALGLTLSLKATMGVKGWLIVYRQKLVSAETLRISALIWGAVAMFFFAGFSFGLRSVVSPWWVAGVVVLILPVNRILWQVIGLDRSRHGQI